MSVIATAASPSVRVCACGCGEPIPADARSDRQFANVRRCAQRWRRRRERAEGVLGDITAAQIERRFAISAQRTRRSGRFRLTDEEAHARHAPLYSGFEDDSDHTERRAISA